MNGVSSSRKTRLAIQPTCCRIRCNSRVAVLSANAQRVRTSRQTIWNQVWISCGHWLWNRTICQTLENLARRSRFCRRPVGADVAHSSQELLRHERGPDASGHTPFAFASEGRSDNGKLRYVEPHFESTRSSTNATASL